MCIRDSPQTLQQASHEVNGLRQTLQEAKTSRAGLEADLQTVMEERHEARQQAASIRHTFTTAKSEMKEQVSGWVRRHQHSELDRKTEQEHWEEERVFFKAERDRWLQERSELERELHMTRQQLAHMQRCDPNDCSYSTTTDTTRYFSR